MFYPPEQQFQIHQHLLQAWPQRHHLKLHSVTLSTLDFKAWQEGKTRYEREGETSQEFVCIWHVVKLYMS